MSRRTSAVLSALITLVIFVGLPLYAPSQIPEEYFEMFSETGVDVNAFIYQIATIGLVASVLTLVKGFVPMTSYIYLLASLSSNAMTLYFNLVTFSVGDLAKLGQLTVTTDIPGGVNTMLLDMRLFIQLAFLAVGLQVIYTVLEFINARKEEAKAGMETSTLPK
ncbi:hypothetical protein ES703_70005 [subsurface metagenome]